MVNLTIAGIYDFHIKIVCNKVSVWSSDTFNSYVDRFFLYFFNLNLF
jgi:hypothetical protein